MMKKIVVFLLILNFNCKNKGYEEHSFEIKDISSCSLKINKLYLIMRECFSQSNFIMEVDISSMSENSDVFENSTIKLEYNNKVYNLKFNSLNQYGGGLSNVEFDFIDDNERRKFLDNFLKMDREYLVKSYKDYLKGIRLFVELDNGIKYFCFTNKSTYSLLIMDGYGIHECNEKCNEKDCIF